MKFSINKKHIWLYVLAIYSLCFALRLIEYFLIRTDSTFFGEAFIHKLLGIGILFAAIKLFSYNVGDVGLRGKTPVAYKIPLSLLLGLALGILCYGISYGTEIAILAKSHKLEKIALFVTSYSVDGNIGNQTAFIFFLICILGNIINVVMEEGIFRGLFQKLFEERYKFFISVFFASILFGLWHCVGPIRSFTDGLSGTKELAVNLAILIGSSTLIGIKYSLLAKITGSLYAGMADHFVNNTLINILHVLSIGGTDELMIIRISIAQTLSFLIVLVLYFYRKLLPCNF
ncbi:MAG: CPBP family intramembrane metalloprotease [Treponemataceae bacterium]|nr:CPBP family intramembrane metalloprotease [Treponemataceae bacterium]